MKNKSTSHSEEKAVHTLDFPDDPEIFEALLNLTSESLERAVAVAAKVDYRDVPSQIKVDMVTIDQSKPPLFTVEDDNRPYIFTVVNKIECVPLLDSGAMVCIIAYIDLSELDQFHATIEPCPFKISTVNGSNNKATGIMWLTYEVAGKKTRLPTVIMQSDKSQFIAGMTFWKAFNLNIGWKDNRHSNESGPAEEMVTEPTVSGDKGLEQPTERVMAATVPIGMLSIKQRVASPQVQQNVRLQRATRNAPMTRPWQYSVRYKPMHMSFEQNETIEEEVAEEPLAEPVRTEIQAAPISLLLDLLKCMPKHNISVNEVTIMPGIQTAAGAHDTTNDILPQKHV